MELVNGGGVAYLPQWVGQNLIGQGTPELRRAGTALLRNATTDSINFDPFSVAQQLVQQGDAPAGIEMLESAERPRPPYDQAALDEMVANAQSGVTQIRRAAEQGIQESERAVHDIGEVRSLGKGHQERLEAVVAEEVGGLASKASSVIQAREYGERATAIEKRANRYTESAIILGALIAVGAVILRFIAASAEDPLERARKASHNHPVPSAEDLYRASRAASGFPRGARASGSIPIRYCWLSASRAPRRLWRGAVRPGDPRPEALVARPRGGAQGPDDRGPGARPPPRRAAPAGADRFFHRARRRGSSSQSKIRPTCAARSARPRPTGSAPVAGRGVGAGRGGERSGGGRRDRARGLHLARSLGRGLPRARRRVLGERLGCGSGGRRWPGRSQTTSRAPAAR